MHTTLSGIALVAALGFSASVCAQKPAAYPAKGQSTPVQETDDLQCLSWAKQHTGIDPALVVSTAPMSHGPRGERLAGAARGAVVGEVIADDARAGAAVGTLAGGRRARMNRAAEVQQSQAQKDAALGQYYRAYGSCMQGRGYTVN